MRIGWDIDGVLADFNSSFIERVIDVTGEDKFPPRPFDIPCWDYPEHYGYTKDQTTKVWQSIKTDPRFWQELRGYHEQRHYDVIHELDMMEYYDFYEVYYITARPGTRVKFQTEMWLENQHASYLGRKTVLISAAKGAVAQALDLEVYVDDKWENCLDVVAARTPINAPAGTAPKTKVFLLSRPWNVGKEDPFVTRIENPLEVLDYINALHEQDSLLAARV